MTEYMMLDELDDEIMDFDSNVANTDVEKVDSILIKKILNEMKCEFNKTTHNPKTSSTNEADSDINPLPDVVEPSSDEKIDEHCDEQCDEKSETSEQVIFVKQDTNDSVTLNEEESEDCPKVVFNPESVIPQSNDNFMDEDTEESYQTSDEVEAIPNGVIEPHVESVKADDNTVNEDDCSNYDVVEKPVEYSANTYTESNSSTPAEQEEISEIKKVRRGSRAATLSDQEVGVKRSSRRMSKENSRESVLQSAIALKEKSFSSLQNDDKPQRRSSRLVESEKTLTTRLRIKTSLTSDTYESSLSYPEPQKNSVKSASIDKTPRYSTEDDADGGHSRSLTSYKTSDYDDQTDHKMIDSGSSESKSNDLSERTKKKRKTGSIQGSKRKKMGFSEKADDSINVTSTIEPEKFEGSQCECRMLTTLYVRGKEDDLLFCSGVDSIEKRAIGCDNLADTTFPLVRPLSRVPFQSLCSVHIERILRHNCCPLCGVFSVET